MNKTNSPGMRAVFINREIYPFWHGGTGTQLYVEMLELVKAGWYVAFITWRHPNIDENSFQSFYEKIDVFFVNDYSEKDIFLNYTAYDYAVLVEKSLDTLWENVRPDLILLADYGGEGFAIFNDRFNKKWANIPIVTRSGGTTLMVVGSATRSYKEFLDNADFKTNMQIVLENACLSCSDYHFGVSTKSLDYLNKVLGLEKKVIPFESDPNVPLRELGREQFYIIPGCTSEDPPKNLIEERNKEIIFVGKLSKIKGAEIFLSAIEHLYKNNLLEDYKISFYGNDYYYEEYDSFFSEYWKKKLDVNLLKKITFHGQIQQNNLCEIYARAELLVFPSINEIYGNIVYEAALYKCPVVVASNCGALDVFNKDCFSLWNNESGVDGLAECIGRLISNKNLRFEFASKAFKRAKELSYAKSFVVKLLSKIAAEKRIFYDSVEYSNLESIAALMKAYALDRSKRELQEIENLNVLQKVNRELKSDLEKLRVEFDNLYQETLRFKDGQTAQAAIADDLRVILNDLKRQHQDCISHNLELQQHCGKLQQIKDG